MEKNEIGGIVLENKKMYLKSFLSVSLSTWSQGIFSTLKCIFFTKKQSYFGIKNSSSICYECNWGNGPFSTLLCK